MKPRQVPFLFTVDIHNRVGLQDELAACLDQLGRVGIRATFFIPGHLAGMAKFGDALRRLIREGHQLGSHGFLHAPPENFRDDPLDVQIAYLQQAKDAIEAVTGVAVTAFRAPSFIVSATTLRALEHCGYRADLSVNSRRVSLISSQIGNVRWLTAPSRPYHPRHDNPYARGRLDLLEIPHSALGLPFTSTLYQALGLTFARGFATMIIADARFGRDRPVVFMAHPEEFYPSRHLRPAMYHIGRRAPSLGRMRWRLFLPQRNGGIRARWLLYDRDEHRIFRNTIKMTKFLVEQRRLLPMTVDQYLAQHDAGVIRDDPYDVVR